MIGLLIFLATIPIFPHIIYVVVAILALFFRHKEVGQTLSANKGFVIGMLLFVVGCLINFLLHSVDQSIVEVPYFVAIPLSVIIAFAMRKRDLRIFLYLLCFEVGVGLYELMNGVQTILPNVTHGDEINLDEDLLYYRTVFGLSVGSNSFAIKLLVGLICVDLLYKDWGYKYILLKIVLIAGLVMSFNRTVIIAYCIYQVVYFCVNPERLPFHRKYRPYLLLAIAAILIGIGIRYRGVIYDSIVNQFTRGYGELALSSRPLIWSQFITFIDQHLLFGNGSYRLLVPYYSGPIHAHNSFLQLIANNGILLGGFFIILTFSKINKLNWVYVLPLLIYSCTQYGIFWGTSFSDIVFFMFLCKPLLCVKDEEVVGAR